MEVFTLTLTLSLKGEGISELRKSYLELNRDYQTAPRGLPSERLCGSNSLKGQRFNRGWSKKKPPEKATFRRPGQRFRS